jgi:glycerol kinase
MAVVVAIDAGTTGVRAIAFGVDGRPVTAAYGEITQHYPSPGRVEHDADEIWTVTLGMLAQVAAALADSGETIAAIGITNQRETVVVWDADGRPLRQAIVWQDRRTADACAALEAGGHLPFVRRTTGLVLDPYFSASKLAWMAMAPDDGGGALPADTRWGTVDAFLLWKLTGGAVHATDASNASRTSLYDIGARSWSSELAELFGVPAGLVWPEVRPSSGRFGITVPEHAAGLRVPVSGMAGDQQAALFGQACFTAGMTKNTYGTGSFVLMNVGTTMPVPVEGLLTTIAWDLGDPGGGGGGSGGSGGGVTYALEGAIFATGAAIQWLRDGLGVIAEAAEIGPLAESVPDTGGVYLVPAFTGLGSPWWDPYARGTIVGITRGTTRAHLARAVVEAMAWQTLDVVEAMQAASGTPLAELRVDGGASVMPLLLQMQADLLGVPVTRAAVAETTALGAAYLAGLAEGVWGSPDEITVSWTPAVRVEPSAGRSQGAALRARQQWLQAVARSRGWAAPDQPDTGV